MLSRVGISVADGTDEALTAAKSFWVDDPRLQPLRRLVEELMADGDWAVGVMGQDLVDQILYPVLYRRLDDAAIIGGAAPYSLVTQHLIAWYADQRKWLDALYQAWATDPEHGAANVTVLGRWLDEWLPRAQSATAPLLESIDQLLGGDAGAQEAGAAEVADIRERFTALGLPGTQTEEVSS
nr:hypothetical protein [Knoellia sp. DB2414S]